MTRATFTPQYRRIERALRERIVGLPSGHRLPSDAELQAEFEVSRMTARNAMQRLADDGLIARQPGRGSFVAEPSAHRRANRLMTFTLEMQRRGMVPSSQLLARTIRPSTHAESTSLGLPPHEPVVHVRRLRCADDMPIAIETTVLIRDCGQAVMTADLVSGSLHETLARAGYVLRRGSGNIHAAAATAEDARLLGIRTGAPILVERRVIADGQGRRIEATESRYDAARYALDVAFDVESPDVSPIRGDR